MGWLNKYQEGGKIEKAQEGVTQLDEVTLQGRQSPKWKAYRDSLNLYNKSLNTIREQDFVERRNEKLSDDFSNRSGKPEYIQSLTDGDKWKEYETDLSSVKKISKADAEKLYNKKVKEYKNYSSDDFYKDMKIIPGQSKQEIIDNWNKNYPEDSKKPAFKKYVEEQAELHKGNDRLQYTIEEQDNYTNNVNFNPNFLGNDNNIKPAYFHPGWDTMYGASADLKQYDFSFSDGARGLYKKPTKPQDSTISRLNSKDVVANTEIESSLKTTPQRAIKNWDVEQSVNQNFGGNTKKFKATSKKELETLKRKQSIDEQTKTGRNNKLKITPNYYQEGGVIEDDRGQWAHPGNVSLKKISNKIRPDYEVNSLKSFNKDKENIKEYLNSEGFKGIASRSYDNVENVKKERLNNLNTLDFNLSKSIGKSPGFFYGMYHPDKHQVELENVTYKSTGLHELNHGITKGNLGISDKEKKLINDSISEDSHYYYKDPTEIQARIVPTRLLLKEKGIYDYNEKEFDENDMYMLLNQIRKNPEEFNNSELKDLLDNVKDEHHFIRLMNTIANNSSIDTNNLAKNGKVIEDNRGQWAHPGKVTKINSNNITMKGVNYPVLGVSNTGDEQMMMPGEDYKFDGESVTEYPMAQEGKEIKKYDWREKRLQTPGFMDDFIEPSFYDSLLTDTIRTKKGTEAQWDDLSNSIAYHESKGDPLAIQGGGGPGRGLYQFEPNSLKTAGKRALNYAKKNKVKVPDYIKNVAKGNITDATKLTPEEQKTLLLIDYRMKPNADLGKYFSGNQSAEDFWIEGHWGGEKEHGPTVTKKRRKSFKRDFKEYQKSKSVKKSKQGGWLDKW